MDSTCQFDVEITEAAVASFAELSGDRNPLHVDPAYARTTEYGRPIVHGALLLGFVSRVLGMHIPGERSLLLSLKARFPKPLFYPARVRVEGRLQSFDAQRRTGLVHVVITDQGRLWPVLEAEAAVAWHEVPVDARDVAQAPAPPAVDLAHAARARGTRACPRLLVTGGTGGVGLRIVRRLSERYELCCLTRRHRSEDGSERVSYDQVDLEAEDALEAYLDGQPASEFYGVVHLSVPPVPRAFVSDDLSMVRRHFRHAVEVPLLLARWAKQGGSRVKRIVLCGSTFGAKYPKPHLGAYALAKGVMEQLTRLLTADLAVQGTTVNVVSPTVIPAGLNEGMSQRAQAALVGKMPTGRLVTPEDVAAVVLFLLSGEAAQINGVTIPVDGGLME